MLRRLILIALLLIFCASLAAQTQINVYNQIKGILSSAKGGTANGWTKFTGPTTAEKTFTLPDANATIFTNYASSIPVAAATLNLGSAALPFANSFIGNLANRTFTWDVSALTGNRTAYVPDGSSTLVVADAGAANNFLTAISAAGAISKARPTCASLSDSSTGCSGAAYPGLVAHNLLSATHGDTTAASPTRGDIITAQAASPTWHVLAKGNQYLPLTMGANEPNWLALALDQTTATSGLLPSSRGGTGNGFTKFTGPASTEKTFTLPNASSTLAMSSGVQTFNTFCSGTATSSQTLFFFGFGTNVITCTGTAGLKIYAVLGSTGTIGHLHVNAGTAGKTASSGAVTLYDVSAGSLGVTCTIGTGTTCSDDVNTRALLAGARLSVKVTTDASETLADISVGFEKW